nr:4Fe-4S dicluster domain-containing protein [Geobacter sp. FeAm09]
MTEVGPFQITADKWEWNYVAVPTQLCDLCADRVAEGKVPSCVLHCLGGCMEYGTVDELAKKMQEKGKKVALFAP